MILWTFQPPEVVRQIDKYGFYMCNPSRSECLKDDNFVYAYDWLTRQMDKRIRRENTMCKYPVWAWHTIAGKRMDIDFYADYLQSSTDNFLLEIDIPDEDVFLTDYELWHQVLNHAINYRANYVEGISDEEWENDSEAEYKYYLSLSEEERKKYLERSWERIIYSPGDSYIPFSIQATFWMLKKEYIRRRTFFPAVMQTDS